MPGTSVGCTESACPAYLSRPAVSGGLDVVVMGSRPQRRPQGEPRVAGSPVWQHRQKGRAETPSNHLWRPMCSWGKPTVLGARLGEPGRGCGSLHAGAGQAHRSLLGAPCDLPERDRNAPVPVFLWMKRAASPGAEGSGCVMSPGPFAGDRDARMLRLQPGRTCASIIPRH